MASAAVPADIPPAGAATGEKGLKKDAIGFIDGLSIGLASTAPAYSLAAVIGSIVVAAGIHTPGVLLLSFVPMFFIAAAFYYMNRVDTDLRATRPDRSAARVNRPRRPAVCTERRKGSSSFWRLWPLNHPPPRAYLAKAERTSLA